MLLYYTLRSTHRKLTVLDVKGSPIEECRHPGVPFDIAVASAGVKTLVLLLLKKETMNMACLLACCT